MYIRTHTNLTCERPNRPTCMYIAGRQPVIQCTSVQQSPFNRPTKSFIACTGLYVLEYHNVIL